MAARHDDAADSVFPGITERDLTRPRLGDVLDGIVEMLSEEVEQERHRSDPPDAGPDTRRSELH